VTALAARVASPGHTGSIVGTAAGVVAIALLLGAVPASDGGLRVAVAVGAAIMFLALALASPKALLPAVVLWLFAVAMLRRLASLDTPLTSFDPLVPAGSLAVGLLFVIAVCHGAWRAPSGLANAVFALSALIAVSALNPLQGSMAAGAVGAGSLLVPMAGFWIGRSLDDRSLARVCKLLATLGVAAAAYGLVQVYRGFPIWDQAWLDTRGYAALNVGIATRPFSTFASSAEHALFLAATVAICVAYARRCWGLVAIGPVAGLIACGLLVAGTRGAVLAAALAVGAVALARLRTPPVAAVLVAVGIVLLVPFFAARLETANHATNDAQALLAHQVSGLSDPLGSDASTLTLHLELARDGLATALREPLGLGAGPITNAPGWLGGIGRQTELDPSNVAVAVGVPGLATYLAVLALGLSRAYSLARARRDGVSLAALGIVVATLFQWLNGGFYLVALLPWLALGWVDRHSSQ
jgi:hypothetical protein